MDNQNNNSEFLYAQAVQQYGKKLYPFLPHLPIFHLEAESGPRARKRGSPFKEGARKKMKMMNPEGKTDKENKTEKNKAEICENKKDNQAKAEDYSNEDMAMRVNVLEFANREPDDVSDDEGFEDDVAVINELIMNMIIMKEVD